MSFHVGIYITKNQKECKNHLVLRDSISNEVNYFSVNGDIETLFNFIKSKREGKNLGCVCFCLDDFYDSDFDNKFRINLMKIASECGIQKCEIIEDNIATYLDIISQAEYQPKNGDIMCIVRDLGYRTWERVNGITKYCDTELSLSLHTSIAKEFLLKEKSVAFFYNEKESSFDKEITAKLFPNYPIFTFVNRNCAYGALTNALILAKEENFIALDVECVLRYEIKIHLQHRYYASFFLLSIPSETKLPYKKCLKLLSCKDYNAIVVKTQYFIFSSQTEQPLQVQDGEMLFTFTIDRNRIFNIEFTELLPHSFSSLDQFLDAYHVESMPLQDDNTPIRYSIPKRIATNDETINAVGIDLGTSRCCAAVNRRNGIDTVALDNEGQRLLPSYVSFEEENIKCGQTVISRLQNYSKSTVFDSKRIIGKLHKDIVKDNNWTFDFFEINNRVKIQLQGNNGKINMFPEEISAALLNNVKQRTEEFQGKELTEAVITVPAAFTEAQNEATKASAIIAGWKTIHLLPEPVAAAFAYFIDRPLPNNSTLLLFDFGGGTLDVCIFKVVKEQLVIISRSGDPNLGGRDFDNLLTSYFKDKLKSHYNITITESKVYKLLLKCQEIKHNLAVRSEDHMYIDDFHASKEGNIKITREDFKALSLDLLKKIEDNITKALSKCEYDANQINKVLYVGGGCRMPMIKDLLHKIFSQAEHCCEEHPDEVVAIGAAYYAYYLSLSRKKGYCSVM